MAGSGLSGESVDNWIRILRINYLLGDDDESGGRKGGVAIFRIGASLVGGPGQLTQAGLGMSEPNLY